jgi:GAF domain-containing protein
MNNGREPQVIDTFLALTDTLVHDFDALDMLTMLAERCVELLDVHAAGVILADGRGGLSVAAGSSERTRLLEVFAVAIDGGPCVECVHTGVATTSEDLATPAAHERWPRYARYAQDAGFRATHALPMRLRGEVIGVLTLLHTDRHSLTESDNRLGQALADAATIGLLHERAIRHAETVQEQLQGALNSRVIIEQAKGVFAGKTGLDPEEAFAALRSHARSRGMRLTDLARAVVDRTVDAATLEPRRQRDDVRHD